MNEPQTPQDNPGGHFAWAKLFLDFIAKALYPAIIIIVLILIYPSVAQIDVPSLIARLQSASIGGTQLTFNQAQDVAITIAPLNSQIAEMNRTIASLEGELEILRDSGVIPVPEDAAPPGSGVEPGKFARNAAYTVLVFHTTKARERAKDITQRLLDAGYVASSTETDFTELSSQLPPGGIRLLHNETGQDVYQWIAEMIGNAYPGAKLVAPDDASNLRRGEVQILLF